VFGGQKPKTSGGRGGGFFSQPIPPGAGGTERGHFCFPELFPRKISGPAPQKPPSPPPFRGGARLWGRNFRGTLGGAFPPGPNKFSQGGPISTGNPPTGGETKRAGRAVRGPSLGGGGGGQVVLGLWVGNPDGKTAPKGRGGGAREGGGGGAPGHKERGGNPQNHSFVAPALWGPWRFPKVFFPDKRGQRIWAKGHPPGPNGGRAAPQEISPDLKKELQGPGFSSGGGGPLFQRPAKVSGPRGAPRVFRRFSTAPPCEANFSGPDQGRFFVREISGKKGGSGGGGPPGRRGTHPTGFRPTLFFFFSFFPKKNVKPLLKGGAGGPDKFSGGGLFFSVFPPLIGPGGGGPENLRGGQAPHQGFRVYFLLKAPFFPGGAAPRRGGLPQHVGARLGGGQGPPQGGGARGPAPPFCFNCLFFGAREFSPGAPPPSTGTSPAFLSFLGTGGKRGRGPRFGKKGHEGGSPGAGASFCPGGPKKGGPVSTRAGGPRSKNFGIGGKTKAGGKLLRGGKKLPRGGGK